MSCTEKLEKEVHSEEPWNTEPGRVLLSGSVLCDKCSFPQARVTHTLQKERLGRTLYTPDLTKARCASG